eukprot:scaffold1437_cov353-Prasinococcus_capsulatus_cf.AAC.8
MVPSPIHLGCRNGPRAQPAAYQERKTDPTPPAPNAAPAVSAPRGTRERPRPGCASGEVRPRAPLGWGGGCCSGGSGGPHAMGDIMTKTHALSLGPPPPHVWHPSRARAKTFAFSCPPPSPSPLAGRPGPRTCGPGGHKCTREGASQCKVRKEFLFSGKSLVREIACPFAGPRPLGPTLLGPLLIRAQPHAPWGGGGGESGRPHDSLSLTLIRPRQSPSCA